jgi:hypothetical protein
MKQLITHIEASMPASERRMSVDSRLTMFIADGGPPPKQALAIDSDIVRLWQVPTANGHLQAWGSRPMFRSGLKSHSQVQRNSMRSTFHFIPIAIGGFCLICLSGGAVASAQSSTRLQYPQQGRIIQSTPVQGSTTRTQGSGSTVQGSGSAVQGSANRAANQTRMNPATAAKETFESKFWRYLNDARYREWAPVHGTSGAAYAGQSPHGAMLKMYLNRKAAGLPDQLPTGSVIVKENYAADGKTLMAVTTMFKASKYDPDGSGWYWTKYNPDGSVAAKDGQRLAGRVSGCIECHSGAAGGDHAFFND